MGSQDITSPDELPEGTTRLGPLVAYGWNRCNDAPHEHTIECLYVWHWCDHHLWTGRSHFDAHREEYRFWAPAGVGAHDLISIKPLHLEASVYWPGCCGMHGWIRDGAWVGV